MIWKWLSAFALVLGPEAAHAYGLGLYVNSSIDLLFLKNKSEAVQKSYQGFGAGILAHVFLTDSKLLRPFFGTGAQLLEALNSSGDGTVVSKTRISQVLIPLEAGLSFSPIEKGGIDFFGSADAGVSGKYYYDFKNSSTLGQQVTTTDSGTYKISMASRLSAGARLFWEARPYIQGGFECTKVFDAKFKLKEPSETLNFDGWRAAISILIRN